MDCLVSGLILWFLKWRRAFYPYTVAISIFWGKALCNAAILSRTSGGFRTIVLWDLALLGVVACWLAFKPSRIAAGLMLCCALWQLAKSSWLFWTPDPPRMWILFIAPVCTFLLNLTAVVAMIRGLLRHKALDQGRLPSVGT